MKKKVSYVFTFGIICLIIPLVFVVVFPDHFGRVSYSLRIITAMGGALMASQLSGFLTLKLPALKAGGGIAVFVFLYWFDPPSAVRAAVGKMDRGWGPNGQTEVDCVAALSSGKTCTVVFSKEGGNDSLSTIARGHVYTLRYRDGQYETVGYAANRGAYRFSKYPHHNPSSRTFLMRGALFAFDEEGKVTSVRDTKAGRKLEGKMVCPK